MTDFGVGILGTGRFLPDRLLTNYQLEKMVDTTNEWIVRRTGMETRHIIGEDTPSYVMGAQASKLAIKNAGLTSMDIDLIIVSTETPDYLTPSMACLIQRDIEAGNAAAFDINGACTGFIYALTVAEQFILTGYYKNILVVSNEGLSRIVDWENRNSCVLFGDAAGAVVLGRVEKTHGIKESYLAAFGNLAHNITVPCCFISEEDREKRRAGHERVFWQDGSEVFTFAIRSMVDSVKTVVEKAGIKIEDVDLIVPHQANLRIINGAAKRLGLEEDKFSIILQETGNISSASVPVALDMECEQGRINKGDTVVLVAFGGGLTCGAIVMTW
ncbi:MAG TPA: beta-ketoacyl-ACP synthase III [Thermoclostridium sp.]|nr:beta-ketoacyl-ACP synthase III [Thermoclostridium sp.]